MVTNTPVSKELFIRFAEMCYGKPLSIYQKILLSRQFNIETQIVSDRIDNGPPKPNKKSYGNRITVMFIDDLNGGNYVQGKEK